VHLIALSAATGTIAHPLAGFLRQPTSSISRHAIRVMPGLALVYGDALDHRAAVWRMGCS
jgi:hypothetical protein